MSTHPIIQQQHEIFRRLQSLVNTDTRLRSEADARLKSEEASAEKEKTRERKRIADKLNAVMEIKAEADNKMTGEWRSQIAGGTAQSTYLLSANVDFDKEWGACQSSAERAQHEVLRLLQKYETPGSTGKAPGCWGAIAAVVLWIIIGAAANGQGWGIGFIFALIAFLLIWLVGAESGKSP